jgi:hypothetical protein
VADSLNNLAILLWQDDRNEEANVYGRQALQIAIHEFGHDHPTTQQYSKDWGLK